MVCRVLVYIYHATASYRIGQQGSKIYKIQTASVTSTLLKGGFYKIKPTKKRRYKDV